MFIFILRRKISFIVEPDGDVMFNAPLVKFVIISVRSDLGTDTYSFFSWHLNWKTLSEFLYISSLAGGGDPEGSWVLLKLSEYILAHLVNIPLSRCETLWDKNPQRRLSSFIDCATNKNGWNNSCLSVSCIPKTSVVIPSSRLLCVGKEACLLVLFRRWSVFSGARCWAFVEHSLNVVVCPLQQECHPRT